MESKNENRTNKTNTNKKRLLKALQETLGIITDACNRTKISRTQFYKWFNEDSEFKTAVLDVQEMQKDIVEAALIKNIRKGKEASIIFYMKTRCKDRGYSEKQELTHDFNNAFSGFTVEIKRNHD